MPVVNIQQHKIGKTEIREEKKHLGKTWQKAKMCPCPVKFFCLQMKSPDKKDRLLIYNYRTHTTRLWNSTESFLMRMLLIKTKMKT